MKRSHNNKPFWKVLILAICAAVAVVFCLSLTSCYTAKKAGRQFNRAVSDYPEIGERYCAREFKPIIERKDSTVYLPGKLSTITKTVMVDCDSAVKYKTRYVSVPCPPSEIRIDTLIQYRYVSTVNTAAVDSANRYALKEHEAQIKAKQSKGNWRIAAIVSISLIILIAVAKIISLYKRRLA